MKKLHISKRKHEDLLFFGLLFTEKQLHIGFIFLSITIELVQNNKT